MPRKQASGGGRLTRLYASLRSCIAVGQARGGRVVGRGKASQNGQRLCISMREVIRQGRHWDSVSPDEEEHITAAVRHEPFVGPGKAAGG
jgi:hypothetical protein